MDLWNARRFPSQFVRVQLNIQQLKVIFLCCRKKKRIADDTEMRVE